MVASLGPDSRVRSPGAITFEVCWKNESKIWQHETHVQITMGTVSGKSIWSGTASDRDVATPRRWAVCTVTARHDGEVSSGDPFD